MASAYKQEKRESTVGDLVADAVSELESLKDEMSEWRDNMEGTGLENTSKFEQVSEAAETLESYVSEVDVPDELSGIAASWFESVHRNKRRGASRSVRLGNAIAMLEAASEALGASEIEGAEDLETEVGELKDNVEGIEFPGMF